MKNGLLYTLLAIGLIFACSCKKTSPPVHLVLEDYTVEDQETIGQAISDEVLSNSNKFPVLPKGQYNKAYTYLNSLWRTLLTTKSVKRRDALDWELFILHNDDKKGIFTAPGGKIFIYTGFLKFVRSENEFLSVLAHEIYYCDTDVAMQRLAKEVDDASFIFGEIVLGNHVEDMESIVCTMESLAFTQTEAIAADNFSIEVLCNFQYHPLGLRDLLVEAGHQTTPIEWTTTRPYSEERLDNIVERATICGIDEVRYEERYLMFKTQYLP